MYSVKCKKADDGSVKLIVAGIVALVVVAIVAAVVIVNNTAASKLNRAIKNYDITEAASIYEASFESKDKEISKKTLELLRSDIAQIQTNYTADIINAEKAIEKLAEYEPFKGAGIEEEYDALYTLISEGVEYEDYIYEGNSYGRKFYGEFDMDEYCYNYEYAYNAYYAAYEIANGNEFIDGSEAVDGLQKIKDYLLSKADEYVENEYYIVAYLWLWEMSQMEYFQDDEDVEEYLDYVTPLKDEQVAEEEAEGYGDETEEAEPEEEESSDEGAEETEEPTSEYALNYIDVFEIDYNEYVDASNWRDAVVTKDMIIEPEYKTQFALAYELIFTYELGETELTGRGAQGGDTLTIDFVGYVDGEEVGNVTGQEIMIGYGIYGDEFDEGLLGAKAGDEITVKATFPDSYTITPEFRGKDVECKVTVLNAACLDEVTDFDIYVATEGEYETYEEYYNDFTESRAKDYEELVIWQEVIKTIKELAVCEILCDDFINTYLNTYATLAEAYDMDIETLLYYYYGYSITVEEFTDTLTPTAEDYALQTCAVLAIADMEGLTVDDNDVDAEYEEMLEGYDSEEEMTEAGYGWSEIKFDMLLDMVEELVYDTIQVK